MAALEKKLTQALAQRFTGADIKLRQSRPGRRVGGTLVWDGFEGEPQIDRQTQLRRAIDAALPAEEQVQVSFILTLTPDEFDSINED
jgi:hypothetical protein